MGPSLISIILCVWLVRAMLGIGDRARGGLRREVRRSFVPWVAFVCLVVAIWIATAPPPWQPVLPVIMLVWLLVPPLLLRVAVPLGWVRTSFWLARVMPLYWGRRAPSVGLPAARALAHRPDVAAAEWLEDRVRRFRLAGPVIVVHGLIADARGDRAGARALLRAVGDLDPAACPRPARVTAAEWLVGDAAERGDWEAVVQAAPLPGQVGARAWLIVGAAERLLGREDAPSELELHWRWWRAGRWRAAAAIVERALEAPAVAEIAVEPAVHAAAPAADDLLGQALTRHAAALLARDADSAEVALRRAGRAWDALLEDTRFERWLALRACELGTGQHATHEALGELRREATTDLAEVVARVGARVDEARELGDTAQRVLGEVRERLLGDLDAASDALRRRVDEKRALPAIDEWRAFCALRALHERLGRLLGTEARRLGFVKTHDDACHLAVWLYNERGERVIGNGMFRWLLREAQAVGDEHAAALQTRNVRCGP